MGQSDYDDIYPGIREQIVVADIAGALVLARELLPALRIRLRDSHQLRLRHCGDGLCMTAAHTACANDAHSIRHGYCSKMTINIATMLMTMSPLAKRLA